MNEWKETTTRIIEAVCNVEANTKREKVIKLAILMYLYKSLENEEIFNDNCEILNKVKRR